MISTWIYRMKASLNRYMFNHNSQSSAQKLLSRKYIFITYGECWEEFNCLGNLILINCYTCDYRNLKLIFHRDFLQLTINQLSITFNEFD